MNDCIRFADKKDIPALCDIWQECFPDSRDYIELFYKNNFERIKVLAFYADGKPVSMLHLIDSKIKNKDESQPAKFIYATGTLLKYRKMGCMSAIIKQIISEAEKEGYVLFLKPSSEATAGFYKSFGFEEFEALKLVSFTPEEKQTPVFYDLSPYKYNRMREEAFKTISHIKWDDEHIKWCVLENEYFSGKTLGIKYENKDYFLLCYPEKDALIINETNLSLNQLKEIGAPLCEAFGTEKIKAYLSADCEAGENMVSALIYNLKTDKPYINLILI